MAEAIKVDSRTGPKLSEVDDPDQAVAFTLEDMGTFYIKAQQVHILFLNCTWLPLSTESNHSVWSVRGQNTQVRNHHH